MPVFDLLIPAVAAGEPLRRSLETVRAADAHPRTCILVLDGARLTPDEQQWMAALPFAVRVVAFPERRGITAALKAGEAEASSEYLARLDAGDEVMPERFSRQIDRLRADRGLAAVGVRTRLVFDGRGRERLSPWVTDDGIARALALRNPFVHGSLMFRLAAFRAAGGYDTAFRTSQDYDLLLRLLPHGRLVVIPDVLHVHHFSPAGSTFVRPRAQLLTSLRAKVRHARRGGATPPAFWAFVARDVASLAIPAALLARIKNRGAGEAR